MVPVAQGDNFYKGFRGTEGWTSPQVHAGEVFRGPEVDVFGIGCVAYYVICGRPPFESGQHVVDGLVPPGLGVNAENNPLVNLLRGLLAYLPEHRLDVFFAMSSQWFSEQC